MTDEKKTVSLDAFEAPNSYTRAITIGDQTRTYLVSELCDADVARVFSTTDAKGNRDPVKVASFPARAVSACVRREDGSEITFDEARAFRRPLLDALIKEVLDVHGYGADQEAVIADHEKN